MQEEKNISHLKSKIWYRFLKVAYILFFVVVFIFYSAFIYEEYGFKSVDQNKTKITCNYEDKKTFSLNDADISFGKNGFKNEQFDYKNFYEGYNDYEIGKIFKKCYGRDTRDIYATQRFYELGLETKNVIPSATMDELLAIEKTISSSQKSAFLNYKIKLFDIAPIYSYIPFIKYLLLGYAIVFFAYEIIRRIFYYIVLGKFFPNKNEGNNPS